MGQDAGRASDWAMRSDSLLGQGARDGHPFAVVAWRGQPAPVDVVPGASEWHAALMRLVAQSATNPDWSMATFRTVSFPRSSACLKCPMSLRSVPDNGSVSSKQRR